MSVDIVHTLTKTFAKVVHNSTDDFITVRGRFGDFRANADQVALKLVTHNTTVFPVGTGSCLPSAKCTRNALYVAVTDSFFINVFTMKLRCRPVQSIWVI